MAKQKKGALSKSPSDAAKTKPQNGGDPAALQKEYKSLQGRNDPQSRARRQQLVGLIRQGRRNAKQAGQQPVDPYQQPQQGIGQGMQQYLNYMQQQGAFQPGSFQDQMNQAYQNTMSMFDQTTAAQFQREQEDFQQMAAERGLDPNSEAYRSLQQQLSQRQDQARQAAMSQAQQNAYAVQSQAFGQEKDVYQMPATMLGQFAPFYGQMGEDTRQTNLLGFQGQQNALDRANQIRLANIQAQASRGGGGGGLTVEDYSRLQQEQAALNMASNMATGGGQQQRRPTFGETAVSTIATQAPNIVMGR